eukprot:3940757-Rhodomonas_salina.1
MPSYGPTRRMRHSPMVLRTPCAVLTLALLYGPMLCAALTYLLRYGLHTPDMDVWCGAERGVRVLESRSAEGGEKEAAACRAAGILLKLVE